jgi:hypothetical protein
MSLEKQCIATRWSAPMEFINKKNGYLIDLDAQQPLVPITDQYQLQTEQFYEKQQMANPNVDHLKQLLHEVIKEKNDGTYKIKTELARKTIIDKYSKEVIKKTFKDIIIEILDSPKVEEKEVDMKGLF